MGLNLLINRIAARPILNKVLKNISWLLLDKIIRMVFGLFVGVWFARYLGPSQFGLYSYAVALVAMFSTVATLGLQGIVVRDVVSDPGSAGETLGTAVVLQLAGGVISFLLLLLLMHWLQADELMPKLVVSLLGLTLFFKASETVKYWFESQVMSKYVVWAETGVYLLVTAGKVAFIVLEAPLMTFIVIAVVEVALTAIALIIVMLRKGSTSSAWSASAARAKTLLIDSWPLILSGVAIMVYMRIDKIMLREMLGNEAVGIYSAAVTLSEVWYYVAMIVVASVFPLIIEAKQRGEHYYFVSLQKLFSLMALLALSIALPITFMSEWIVNSVFGHEYSSAYPILGVHIWAAIFVFQGVASSRWFIIEDLQILVLYRTISGACINIGLNYALIPKFGGLGAAWATLVAQAFASVLLNAANKKTKNIFLMQIRAFIPLGARFKF